MDTHRLQCGVQCLGQVTSTCSQGIWGAYTTEPLISGGTAWGETLLVWTPGAAEIKCLKCLTFSLMSLSNRMMCALPGWIKVERQTVLTHGKPLWLTVFLPDRSCCRERTRVWCGSTPCLALRGNPTTAGVWCAPTARLPVLEVRLWFCM